MILKRPFYKNHSILTYFFDSQVVVGLPIGCYSYSCSYPMGEQSVCQLGFTDPP